MSEEGGIKLNDKKLINEINVLLINASESRKLHDHENQCKYLEKMFNLYKYLSLKSKKQFQKSIYYVHRDLGQLYFISNQIEKALYHLQEAKKLKKFNEEKFLNRCDLKRLMINANIKLGLKTNSYFYFKDAKDLNSKLLTEIEGIDQNSLKDEIDSNKLFLDSINYNDEVKTIIEFEIPSPLPIQNDNPIKFIFNGIEHILNIEIIENPSSNVKGSGIPIIEDKYGLVKRSKINLTICKYIDSDELVEIKTFSYKKYTFKVLLEAVNALNYFIERYKIVTGNYWIETIFFKMIPSFIYEVKLGNQRFGNLIGIYEQGYLISPQIPYLNKTEMARLNNYLEIEEIPLWKLLLLNAKDYLLRRDYREAIYAINGAFENYLMLKAREKLIKAWGQKNAIEYLDGEPIYEYHNLKEYMDEETFKKAVKDKKIGTYIPPTGQILKECYNLHPLTISRTKLDKLVKKIRKNRNEVIHGVKIKDDLETTAFEAIESFEYFVKVF